MSVPEPNVIAHRFEPAPNNTFDSSRPPQHPYGNESNSFGSDRNSWHIPNSHAPFELQQQQQIPNYVQRAEDLTLSSVLSILRNNSMSDFQKYKNIEGIFVNKQMAFNDISFIGANGKNSKNCLCSACETGWQWFRNGLSILFYLVLVIGTVKLLKNL